MFICFHTYVIHCWGLGGIGKNFTLLATSATTAPVVAVLVPHGRIHNEDDQLSCIRAACVHEYPLRIPGDRCGVIRDQKMIHCLSKADVLLYDGI